MAVIVIVVLVSIISDPLGFVVPPLVESIFTMNVPPSTVSKTALIVESLTRLKVKVGSLDNHASLLFNQDRKINLSLAVAVIVTRSPQGWVPPPVTVPPLSGSAKRTSSTSVW